MTRWQPDLRPVNLLVVGGLGGAAWFLTGSLCIAMIIWFGPVVYWPSNWRARVDDARGIRYRKDPFWWIAFLLGSAVLLASAVLCGRAG